MRNRHEYENLINGSVLFALDKDKEPTLYKKEKLKMTEYLFRYLMCINENEYGQYGYEIYEVSKACIENFDSTKGSFLTYFLSSWKQQYSRTQSSELFATEFGFAKFSERQKRNYVKYKKCCSRLGIDTSAPDFDKRIAEDLSVTIEEVHELKLLDETRSESIDDPRTNDDDTPVTQYKSAINIELEYENINTAKLILSQIEIVFSGIQERQKKPVSMLLTSSLSLKIDDEDVLEHFRSMLYFNEEIFDKCVHLGKEIPNKEIASALGVNEASLSRTWKGFKEKLNTNNIFGSN